ncbi:hypothetical protein AX15_005677 [Amanita polypyramis BW_CC]|nr:hypothetical protein AX15_005677 [Amanita polypyramis BW_CC]
MDFDDLFEDFDDTALQKIDAEAAALLPIASTTIQSGPPSDTVSDPKLSGAQDDSFGLSFNIGESELQKLDPLVTNWYNQSTACPGPSRLGATIQTTLDGGFVTPSQKPASSRSQYQRANSSTNNLFGRTASKTKKWDHTEFAKTGCRPAKKSKGKGRVVDTDGWGGEEVDYEFFDFDQFPAPFGGCYS